MEAERAEFSQGLEVLQHSGQNEKVGKALRHSADSFRMGCHRAGLDKDRAVIHWFVGGRRGSQREHGQLK